MKFILKLGCLALLLLQAVSTQAQPLTVTTIAGRFGVPDYTNATGTNALLGYPKRLTADKAGNLYFIDGQSVRKINSALAVTTLAGQWTAFGFTDATGTDALFNSPSDLAVDQNGTVYVADNGNFAIRKISPAGVVTTLAGDGTQGYLDGDVTTAKFDYPDGIAVDSATNVYVADSHRIRKITAAGLVTTLAGSSSDGFLDGTNASAQFWAPYGLAVDAGGTVYVADDVGIRKVSPAGVVTTWVGSPSRQFEANGGPTNAGFHDVMEIVLDRAGGAYVADNSGPTIRYVSPAGVVTTVAGLANVFTPITNSNDGVGSNARFRRPAGVALDTAGNVYIVDQASYTILKGVPPSLSPIGSFSESAGITPVRFNNPWQFTAHFTNIVSGLRLRVQSTTTTNVEGSWTDLPGNLHMTDVDGNWNLNTTNVPTGTNRFFRAVASAPGYFDSASGPAGPETVLGPPQLSPILLFLVSDGGTPVRSSNPWQFLAYYTNLVSGLQLHVQSTTTNDAGSWQDLRGIQYMTNNAGTWTLDKTDVPTGVCYFRAVASAPGYVNGVSPIYGPETVLPGFDLWGYFSYATSFPYSTHTPWSFAIGQSSQIPGMSLRVQASTSPGDPNSWSNLPGSGQMSRYSDSTVWALYTTNVPTGPAVSFRVIASAPDYVDLASGELGTFDIGLPLPVQSTNVSQGGTYTVQSLADLWNGIMHEIHAIGVAVHLIHDGTTASQAAITLDADSGGSVDLQVAKGQTITGSVNVRSNATFLLSGTVDGNVSVGLVSHDGGSLVSHDGGSLVSHDGGSVARIAEIVAQGGGNLVSHDGGSIVAQGGGNIVAQGGGNIVAQGGGNFHPQSVEKALSALAEEGTGLPHLNDLTQPSFTGQMIINGNYDQFAAGTLVIAIAGTNTLNDGAQQYDQLVVSGRANLIGGTIVFGLFNPDDQTNRANVFQPPDGSTFDVVVASNIVVNTVRLLGLVWGDGQFFTGSVVTRTDGLQAVRLVATHIPPEVALRYSGPTLQLLYANNYTGYTVQSTLTLSATNWTTFSAGTNIVDIPSTNDSAFFRLYHP